MLINNKNAFYNKIIPTQNILAEEIIIGHLLLNIQIEQKLINNLNSNFFTLQKYQMLFFYIKKKNYDYNLIKIVNELWNKKILSQIGGISNIIYIIQKSHIIISNHNQYNYIQYLINILYYYYIKRLFIQYSRSIFHLNYFNNISIEQIHNKCIKYLITISKSKERQKNININTNIIRFIQDIHQLHHNNYNILSCFNDLDKITNGFKQGELIVVAGRPSMGKTSLAINISYNAILHSNIQVHIFSLEMSKEEIIDKLIALTSNTTLNKIQKKKFKIIELPNIKSACQKLISLPLYIDDSGNASLNYIKSQCKKLYRKKNFLIIIDYLQLIKSTENNKDNRSQEIGNITRELKLLAKQIQAPILILSQLNRNIENRINKRPLLSDLRESGCISYYNIPYLQKKCFLTFIETLHCLQTCYILNRYKHIEFKISKYQYTYQIRSYSTIPLDITHNHKVLSYTKWQKEDQIKKQNFHNIKLKDNTNSHCIIELNILNKIQLLNKVPVYDIKLYEYYNFIINKYIVHNSIEQDADLILMLYKDHDNLDNKIIDITIAKHRNGPIGAFQLLFHPDTCKFQNIQENHMQSIY